MQRKQAARGAGLFSLAVISLFVLTRKEYELPRLKFFVPNIPVSRPSEEKIDYLSYLKYIDIRFVTKPKSGWLISFKPIYGVKLPINILLPPAFFVAIPQIKKQIKDKIHIKPRIMFGILYGYDITIDRITFWA